MTIWTIGHSTLPIEEFLALLEQAQIEELVDVRRFPGSRRHPQFSQHALGESLGLQHIRYEHFPDLGGHRKPRADSVNLAWKNESFRGYADYMTTAEFRDAIARLLKHASERRTTIMCAEAVWWRCHRGLVADYLKAMGHDVRHIMGTGKIEPHPFTSAAAIVGGKLSYQLVEQQRLSL